MLNVKKKHTGAMARLIFLVWLSSAHIHSLIVCACACVSVSVCGIFYYYIFTTKNVVAISYIGDWHKSIFSTQQK